MASKNSSSLALFLTLNILLFTLTVATDCGRTPSPCVPSPSVPSPSVPCPSAPCPLVPSPSVPSPLVPSPSVPSPLVPSPSVPCPSVPIPNPGPVVPPITPVSSGYCPINTLKLGVCADVISTTLKVQLGQPSSQPCCSLIHGLIDLDAAFCFCTALKANVLGMNIDIPISLSVLLNFCKRKVPYGFECA